MKRYANILLLIYILYERVGLSSILFTVVNILIYHIITLHDKVLNVSEKCVKQSQSNHGMLEQFLDQPVIACWTCTSLGEIVTQSNDFLAIS